MFKYFAILCSLFILSAHSSESIDLYTFLKNKKIRNQVPEFANKIVIPKDIKSLKIEERIEFINFLEDQTEQKNIKVKGLEHSLRLGREGNGGDSEALEIQEIAHDMVNQIRTQQSLYFKDNDRYDIIDIDLLSKLVDATAIFLVDYKLCSKSKDTECPKERGFTVKNYPESLEIHVNYKKWKKLSAQQKIKLIAHEFFGLMGVEKGVYNLSNELVVNATKAINYKYITCMISLREKSDTGIITVYTGHISVSTGSSKSQSLMLKPLHTFSKLFFNRYIAGIVISSSHFRLTITEPKKVTDTFYTMNSKGKVYIPETVIVSDDFNTTKEFHTEEVAVTVTCHGV